MRTCSAPRTGSEYHGVPAPQGLFVGRQGEQGGSVALVAAPGVVDQDFEAAVRVRGLGQGAHGRVAGVVAGHGNALAAGRGDQARGVVDGPGQVTGPASSGRGVNGGCMVAVVHAPRLERRGRPGLERRGHDERAGRVARCFDRRIAASGRVPSRGEYPARRHAHQGAEFAVEVGLVRVAGPGRDLGPALGGQGAGHAPGAGKASEHGPGWTPWCVRDRTIQPAAHRASRTLRAAALRAMAHCPCSAPSRST